MSDLRNKVAVITGGGSGIGEAISQLFASSGASVRILDSDIGRAESVAKALRMDGHLATAHECDVSSQSSVRAAFEEVIQPAGIDVLVNNAGISHIGKLENTTEADLDRIFQVNVKGAYNCMYSCIAHMKARRCGVILNIASIAGMVALADRFAYSMSKGALLAMTYSVAKDYLPYNIRCNCISPARIHTPFVDDYLRKNYQGQEKEVFEKLSRAQPMGRMGEPREVALLARFLCSDESSFITGANYPLDGGTLTLSVPS
jgi:NAD(P)-dependent dehydrogenase (short-subunit alcohol dehydrogenase family)